MNKLETVGLLVLITLLCPAWVQAQGKLGRVRESVRRTKPKPVVQAREKDRDQDDDRDKKKNNKRKIKKQPRRQRRSRNASGSVQLPIINQRVKPRPAKQIHVHETVFVSPVVLTSSPMAAVPQPVLLPQPTGISGTTANLESVYVPTFENTAVHSQTPTVVQPIITAPESFEVSATPENDPCLGDSYFCSLNDWFSRVTVQGGSDFDGLGQGGIGLLLQPTNSLGLEAAATLFRESGTEFRDHLWLGDVNLLFEPVSGDVRLRFGIGLNWLGDTFGGEAGFNLTAGTDIQLTNRWVLTGEIDYGTLGDSDLLHTQVTLGAVFGNREVFAGYNYYDIGGAELDGVIFGLRFRF